MGEATMRWMLVAAAILGAAVMPAAAPAGNSLLAVRAKQLLVANPDNGSVSVLDLRQRRVAREIAVGRRPESVAWIGSSPLAAVTLYDEDQLVILNTMTGKIEERIATAPEPYGVIVDRAGKWAYVTSEYPGVVSVVDLDRRAVTQQWQVGNFPRGLCFSADEKRVLVAHYYSAELTSWERASGKMVDSWKGSSSDNLARQVTVHPTLPYAYVPHIRSKITVAHGAGSIFPYISIHDLRPPMGDKRRRITIAMDSYNGVIVTANPWEVAVSPDGKRHYTLYSGTNDMNVSEVLDDEYRYIRPATRLVPLGNNPRAVAVSDDSQEVYVYNSLDFAVAVYRAEPLALVSTIKVCDNPYGEEILRGKKLFNLARAPMTRLNWISCSSCHPDGDHDGRTWQNPEGLRRTTHFFGMARTYPLHWSADRDELQDFEHTIRGPLMQGFGLVRGPAPGALAEPIAGRSRDLDALAAYCNSLEHRLSPHLTKEQKLTAAAERGRTLFFSAGTHCATCHSGPDYTDRQVHDVGTGNADPSEKMGPKYDTPTLLRAYRNREYLHHGKAKSLREVFTTFNQGDKHGITSHLKPNQIDDLVEFVKSLPYELPSTKTVAK